jgi:hypothetical protein
MVGAELATTIAMYPLRNAMRRGVFIALLHFKERMFV